MRWIRNFSVLVVLILLVDSCLKQPEYSVVPEINLVDLTFKPGDHKNLIADTLKITIHFQDGDGDLGIGASDSSSLNFQSPWYYAYDTVNFDIGYTSDKNLTLPGAFKFINYKARKLPQFDTIPSLDCANWEELLATNGSGQTSVKDTIYVRQNTRAFNIFVDVYEKNTADGTYTLFDPATYSGFPFPSCNVNFFRATFPNLSTDEGKKSPLDGTLKYGFASFTLPGIFSIKTLQLQIHITDRAFNKSNVIITKDFTLASITK
jgi:hypothetical protein